MSAFAGLVTRDRHSLQSAVAAWQSPLRDVPVPQDWHFEDAYFCCWAADAVLHTPTGPDGWLGLIDGRIGAAAFAASTSVAAGQAEPSRSWPPPAPGSIATEFALAAWHDGNRELYLCRDAIGGYPIFYHETANGVAFATDLPLLLRLPFVPRRLNQRTIAGSRARDDSLLASDSFYESIKLLPAGHSATYNGTGMQVRRWWHPKTVAIAEPNPAGTLRAEIVRSVTDRMRDGQRVAVHLSGGLDSSAIACIAARQLQQEGKRLLAISSVLPPGWHGPETDERAHIQAVLAQEPNIDIHWLSVPLSASPFTATERVFETLGQPAYSSVPHIDDALGRLGRQLGVDVVLSGFAGDFFASWRGDGVIAALVGEGDWSRAFHELSALRARGFGSWARLVKRHLLAPLVRGAMAGRTLTHRSFHHAPPRRQMAFVAEPGHLERALNSSVRMFDRAYGQSLRFPLLDRGIVELMLTMPTGELQQRGENRSLFRRAMKDIVPEQILMRQDKGAAFDPQLAARILAAREDLEEWANRPCNTAHWSSQDRTSFLEELSAIKRSGRDGWRDGMFRHILVAGTLARFAAWHADQAQDHAR
ncbi:MAG: asparagine synthase-related protein [Sphingomonas sp.]